MKAGYASLTVETTSRILRNLARTVNLDDPEAVKVFIARKPVSVARKEVLVTAYDRYVKLRGLTWRKPIYKRPERLPYVPLETLIDQLIGAMRPRYSAFLQFLKETGSRPGEAWGLKWVDVRPENNIVIINQPEKGSNARVLKVSTRLIAMLLALPRKGPSVFRWKGGFKVFKRNFIRYRNRAIGGLQNPDLKLVSFYSLRHFKATVEYARTKDLLYVKQILGHKSISSTLRYTHLIDFKTDDYVCKAAKTVEEASKLIEGGFDYVTEIDGIRLFRKRK